MHYLHYRFVTEQPRSTINRFLQLLDDFPQSLQYELLRHAYVDFNVLSDESDRKARQTAEFAALKAKLRELNVISEKALVYGFGCFVLANVHDRLTRSLPHFIDMQRSTADGALDALFVDLQSKLDEAEPESDIGIDVEAISASAQKNLRSLHDEHDLLRRAYHTFCEMVVAPLLDDEEPPDFGGASSSG